MDKRPRRGGLVGPLILIGLGVVFLLSNLGVLEWDVWWTLLRIWPVFLIAGGIDLLVGRRSFLGSLLALVLIVAVFAGAFWLVWRGEAGPVGTGEEISQDLDGATRAEIVLGPAVGRLHVEALSESSRLVKGTVVHPSDDEELERKFEVKGGVAEFTLQTTDAAIGPFVGVPNDRVWDFGFNGDVPLDLEIDLGVGLAELDLQGLTVSDLDVSFGVGQTAITLPAEGDFLARVDGAIGHVVIVVPRGMEVRIRLDTALVTRQLPQGYRCQDGVCTSPGYAGADNLVDLEIDMAIGNVSVRADR